MTGTDVSGMTGRDVSELSIGGGNLHFFVFFTSLFLTNHLIRIRFRLPGLFRHRGQPVLDLGRFFNRDVFDGQLLFA